MVKGAEDNKLRKSALCSLAVTLSNLEHEQLTHIGPTEKYFFAGLTLEHVMSIARRVAAGAHVDISTLPSFEHLT